jgi:RNA recognition motif-containing protein
MQIYVGNLSYKTTDADLRDAFERFGRVEGVQIIMDKVTNRSRGFAFVEMPDASEGSAAVEGMNGQDLQGRELRVNEARPQAEKRPPRPGGGGGRGGGGGYR